jgi:hypothetical protein
MFLAQSPREKLETGLNDLPPKGGFLINKVAIMLSRLGHYFWIDGSA